MGQRLVNSGMWALLVALALGSALVLSWQRWGDPVRVRSIDCEHGRLRVLDDGKTMTAECVEGR